MQRILFLCAVVLSSLTNVFVHAEGSVSISRQQFNEGMKYYVKSNADDCDANCSKAYGLFINAAKGGDCDALVMAGVVNKDKTKEYLVAWKAFLTAIDQCNHMLALYHLGDMYERGLVDGVKSYEEAEVMYYLALHGNLPHQKQTVVDMYLDTINEKLSKLANKTDRTIDDVERLLTKISSKEDLKTCKSSPRNCFVFKEYFPQN